MIQSVRFPRLANKFRHVVSFEQCSIFMLSDHLSGQFPKASAKSICTFEGPVKWLSKRLLQSTLQPHFRDTVMLIVGMCIDLLLTIVEQWKSIFLTCPRHFDSENIYQIDRVEAVGLKKVPNYTWRIFFFLNKVTNQKFISLKRHSK